MATVYNTTFKLRRGLKEVWEKNNPILAQGEPGFELDTYRLKIGDGISNWNNLPYVANGEISVSTDGLSIILNEKNEISLAGFDEANLGQLLRKNKNGELEWFTPTINDLEQTETIFLFGGSASEVL